MTPRSSPLSSEGGGAPPGSRERGPDRGNVMKRLFNPGRRASRASHASRKGHTQNPYSLPSLRGLGWVCQREAERWCRVLVPPPLPVTEPPLPIPKKLIGGAAPPNHPAGEPTEAARTQHAARAPPGADGERMAGTDECEAGAP